LGTKVAPEHKSRKKLSCAAKPTMKGWGTGRATFSERFLEKCCSTSQLKDERARTNGSRLDKEGRNRVGRLEIVIKN